MSKYDELVKQLAVLRPKDFIEWVCPHIHNIEKVSFEDREFPLTYRRVDTLYKVKAKEVGKFFVHLEFQASLSSDLSIRLHEYSVRIRRQLKSPVMTVVVFLNSTPAIKAFEPVDRLEFAGTISEFHYTKIILSEQRWLEIINKGLPALWSLIPLTRIPKGDERQALSKATEAIEHIPDKELRGELAAVLYLLGGYRYSGTIKEIMKEKVMQDLMQSKTYHKMAEEERMRGKLQGKLEDLLNILSRRDKVSKKLQKRLQAIQSLEKLDNLIDIALTTESLAEFVEKMEYLICQ